jgi:hypothetical protein
MNAVRFATRPRDDLGGAIEIVPMIDGGALSDLIHEFELRTGIETTRSAPYGGLVPAHFKFGRLDRHFLGEPASGASKVPVLGCSCGEWGCWPLLVRIQASSDVVTWTEFEQPFRKERDYSQFGPFAFRRADYDGALEALPAVSISTSAR